MISFWVFSSSLSCVVSCLTVVIMANPIHSNLVFQQLLIYLISSSFASFTGHWMQGVGLQSIKSQFICFNACLHIIFLLSYPQFGHFIFNHAFYSVVLVYIILCHDTNML